MRHPSTGRSGRSIGTAGSPSPRCGPVRHAQRRHAHHGAVQNDHLPRQEKLCAFLNVPAAPFL